MSSKDGDASTVTVKAGTLHFETIFHVAVVFSPIIFPHLDPFFENGFLELWKSDSDKIYRDRKPISTAFIKMSFMYPFEMWVG